MSSCRGKVDFEECELAILRSAVDKAELKTGRKKLSSPEVQEIVSIVERFLKDSNCVCYGGTAINNILPENDRFYNPITELPDYDFYSLNALADAKRLADIYCKAGFSDVEAKSGVHVGTYKVYVNYIPIADITHIDKELFSAVRKAALTVDGIKYAPPDFLRQSMYLELSRPEGDVERWEKVLKRLTLLNKHYPLSDEGYSCDMKTFQRGMDADSSDEKDIFYVTRDCFIDQGVVFIGAYADGLYARYMPASRRRLLRKVPDFDVLATEPERVARVVTERLEQAGFNNVRVRKKSGIGELVAPHYEVLVGKDTIAFVYEPTACHSYNTVRVDNRTIKVGTLDTLLSFYLAFVYAGRPYHDIDRLVCMATFLFEVQQQNRLAQKGLLKRFSINCYGQQHGLDNMRKAKTEAYEKLKGKRGTKEWEKWFLNYRPDAEYKGQQGRQCKGKTTRKKKKRKKKTKKKTKKRWSFANLV
jgi:hypothetical protein